MEIVDQLSGVAGTARAFSAKAESPSLRAERSNPELKSLMPLWIATAPKGRFAMTMNERILLESALSNPRHAGGFGENGEIPPQSIRLRLPKPEAL
jgi:hypothetical protein